MRNLKETSGLTSTASHEVDISWVFPELNPNVAEGFSFAGSISVSLSMPCIAKGGIVPSRAKIQL